MLPAFVFAETVRFTADDSIILNPERGLAKLMTVGPNSIGELQALRADNHTVAWGLIRLGSFTSNPVLTNAKLQEVTAWLEAARVNKVKVVLRVVYHEEENFNPPSASLDVQHSHLQQLGTSALKPYQDVILALQAGGIGAYGEWFYAPPELITGDARKELLDSMFDASADDAFVMVRTPHYKQQYEATGADADKVSRTAHYNDCFLSSANDTGTYLCYPFTNSCPAQSVLENLVANDSVSVPVGGETCNATPRNDCAATLAAMERFGYSFINTLWFSSIRSKWQAQGCFDEITKQLGYRFELVEADIPDSISPGGDFQVSVTVRNVGWARLYKQRPVYIRMTDENDNELLFQGSDTDAREWLAGGQSYTFTTNIVAPANLETETVSLSLWMPDNDERHYRTPEYSIQLANTDTWNPVAGDNLLAASVPVSSVVSNSCDQTISIPDRQWMLLSLPCQSATVASVGDLFADDILINGAPAQYGSDWLVFTFDPTSPNGGEYNNPGVNGSIQPGQGFWFLQLTGETVTLDMPAGSQPVSAQLPRSQACVGATGCLNLSFSGTSGARTHWHILGNPSSTSMNAADLRLSTIGGTCQSANGGCTLNEAQQQGLVSSTMWGYSNGAYVRYDEQSSIGPWLGFWFAELQDADGESPVLHLPIVGSN